MPPFMKHLLITHRCTMRYRERELADTGLNACHPPYLLALYREPGIAQDELARRMEINRSTAARQLASLESLGYIRREPAAEDRRSLLVYPTQKALDLQPRLMQTLRAWREYLTADFTPQEQELLSQLLARMAERARNFDKGENAPCAPSDNT